MYFAKDAMEVLLVELAGDTLKVESEQLLALSDKLSTDVAFAGLRGMSSGQGLFTTTVTGYGTAALLSSGGPPIALGVSPQFPLVVDPDAFIASQGQLNQTFVTDVSWRNLIGESSGEAFSLRFDGHGRRLHPARGAVDAFRAGQREGRERARRARPGGAGPPRRHARLHRAGAVRAGARLERAAWAAWRAG